MQDSIKAFSFRMPSVQQNAQAINSPMNHKHPEMTVKSSVPNAAISVSEAVIVQSICCTVLAIVIWTCHNVQSITLISHPSQVLFLIWVIECPFVILLYSRYRQNNQQCSYLRAVGRGILGLLAGALISAFGAVALGAPVSSKYLSKTVNWSLAMSLFTVAPAASVFGSSWTDWQRLFAYTKPVGPIDYFICVPAHGAIIGAWFGAWPMPLDWERQWQEWPICVSYGAIAGYFLGMAVSVAFVLAQATFQHTKTD